jgi:hypothetical protein
MSCTMIRPVKTASLMLLPTSRSLPATFATRRHGDDGSSRALLRLSTLVAFGGLSCNPPPRPPSALLDAGRLAVARASASDAGELRDAADLGDRGTTLSRTAFAVVPHPTPAELASLQGPRRPALCMGVEGTVRLPRGYGGTVQNEQCEGVPFTLRRSQYDDELAVSQEWIFSPSSGSAWSCYSVTTQCMSLVRGVLTRRSADGSFVEFTCNTTRHRVDRRRAARSDWPCDEASHLPSPLYVRINPWTAVR